MKPASTFLKELGTYKRVLAVLLRPTCVSLAVSNHYVSLAEPLGALMLRDLGPRPPIAGKNMPFDSSIVHGSAALEGTKHLAVPKQTLMRMLRGVSSDLDGVVWGAEHLKFADVMLPHLEQHEDLKQQQQQQTRAIQKEVAAILERMSPGLSATWWDEWSASTPASCRLLPPGGPMAAATVEQAEHLPSIAAAQGAGAAASAPTSSPSSLNGLPVLKPGRPAPCSMATVFLQHFLDENCTPNTFG